MTRKPPHKRTIIDAFSAATATYESAAEVQARTADRLVDLALPLPANPRVLEVGCGTGLLTRRLLAAADGGSFLVTDISPAMVKAAKAAIADKRCRFWVMDGEHPKAPPAAFDLVASNLAAQWFLDLPAALARLAECVAPGGRLLVSTLGPGSFAEWRQAQQELGQESGMPDYPAAAELAAMLPADGRGQAIDDSFWVAYDDARAFLAALKAIGAATPKAGYRPLAPGTLRRTMARLGAPCAITWEVVTLVWEKPRA